MIKKLLLNDWNDVNFVIGSKLFAVIANHIYFTANPKDFIEVKFDLDTLDHPSALKSYMNTLVNSNDDL